jgi:myo-inositol-1(or 4)-monophosphatase
MTDVELAIALAETGAEIVRMQFGTQLQRIEKSAGDFATNADVDAEMAMTALLRRERPHDGVIGEEGGQSGSRGASRTWFIDPLCGTLNYAVQMRVVAVNVALKEGAAFTAAAVADPFNNEIFWTDGTAAWRRSPGGDTPLAPSASSRLVDLNLDPPFPSAPAFKATTLAADSGFAATFRPRVVSTSMALTWVATGQRAAYVTERRCQEQRALRRRFGVVFCGWVHCDRSEGPSVWN